MKIIKLIKKFFSKKPDLRELVLKELGEEGVEKYDKINQGIPIGCIFKTIIFLNQIDNIKEKYGLKK